MSELKNCPFCNCNYLDFISDYVMNDDYCDEEMKTRIMCKRCGGAGGFSHNEKEAIEAWNKRVDNE